MTKRVMCAAICAALFAAPAFADNEQKQGTQSQPQSKQTQGAAAGASTQKSQDAGKQSMQGFAVVLVPITVAAKQGQQERGDCWARLHTEDNFRGDQLSLVGPVDMPNMRTPFGRDWSGEFESIAIGPKATVTVYDNENYQQRAATFKPGQKVPELDEKLGFFEQIRSVKIACAGGAKTAKSASGSKDKRDAGSGATSGK